jgi:alpha-amylase
VPPRISLALTFHNHQPIGNFGWVVSDVYDRAYAPMVAALWRHPGVRAGLHYSGPLLEWLERERPGLLDRVVELVGRGQVELLGGALQEPILASIPERDRLDQLLRLGRRIEALTGVRPRGAWLAERVWEPDLPRSLADAGYEWTIVDDAHFRAAGLPEDAAWGPWRTEDQGHGVAVFATDQGLRYGIPFRPVAAVLEYLREAATPGGDRLATMGDDGEKFGAWPTTFEHCWGPDSWVDRFFEALEANADWLATVTPSSWLDHHAPRGLAYLPTASYAEMGGWALAADEGLAFSRAWHAAVDGGRPEARWLRGAPWRSFLVKYREANDAHKQMLRASAAVHSMAPGPARDRALDHLYRGQSNDSYWHGLFGGLYLPDLRVAALGHLIAAQDLADGAGRHAPLATLADLDADGRDEVLLGDAGQVVVVDLAEGAGIGAWDLRAARHPVAAVLRRRPEAYHATLRELEAAAPGEPAADATAGDATAGDAIRDPGAPATIHDIVAAKERDLSRHLQYDDHERRLGLVRLLAPDVTPEAVVAGKAPDLGDFVADAFTIAELGPARLVVERAGAARAGGGVLPFRVVKSLRLGGDRRSPALAIELGVENRGATALETRIGLELPTMLLGGGGNPAAWIDVAGRRSGHDSAGMAAGVSAFRQGNDLLGLRIDLSTEPPADVWWAPIETISNSEAGFERVYQGSGLLLSWLRHLAPGEPFLAIVRLTARIAEDRAATEAGS